jgi:hypothetical protein
VTRKARSTAGEEPDDSVFDDRGMVWQVAVGEHRWANAAGHRVLTDDPATEARSYYPAKEPGLFIRFAELERGEAGFAAFANEFGRLGVERVELGAGVTQLLGATGEPWSAWDRAHTRMKRAVRLWRALEDGEVSAELLRPAGKPRDLRGTAPTKWLLFDPGHDRPVVTESLAERNPIRAAGRFVQRWVNDGLKDGAVVRVLWHPDHEQYVFRVRPSTLLGAMWWQLGRALAGEVRLRECRVCRKPIGHGPETPFIASREFCSQACKQKDHRARVRRAKDLKAEGRTVRQIAARLGTTPDVITNWLTKSK